MEKRITLRFDYYDFHNNKKEIIEQIEAEGYVILVIFPGDTEYIYIWTYIVID